LAKARAAGAAITDALSNWEALIPKLMYAANTDPGRLVEFHAISNALKSKIG
jgi:hypothetical protein